MTRRMAAFCLALAMLAVSALPAAGDIRIRTRDQDSAESDARDSVTVIRTDPGPEEDSFAYQMAHHAYVSQRDARFATAEFQYINREPFSKNGCGPSSLFNGLQTVLGDMPVEGMLELMTLMADFHRPAVYGMNYNRVMTIHEADPEAYPVITAALSSVDRWIPMAILTEEGVLALAREDAGTTVVYGRYSLTKNPQAFVRIAEGLCALGEEDAVLCLATISVGTEALMTPFGMGAGGHFVTLVAQAGEFCESGAVYVVDSFPRALRDETISERYPYRYYFAASNGMSPFRQHYAVTRLQPTVIMCTLDMEIHHGHSDADIAERADLLNMITTYGTGTLFIRFGDH